MKIEITTDSDIHECETCGSSWASGGSVFVNGVEIVNMPAVAHCYGGTDVSESELLVLALEALGYSVIVDGDLFHINQSDARDLVVKGKGDDPQG